MAIAFKQSQVASYKNENLWQKLSPITTSKECYLGHGDSNSCYSGYVDD